MTQHSYAASDPRTLFDFRMRQQIEALQETCLKQSQSVDDHNAAYRQGYQDGFDAGIDYVIKKLKNLADA